MNQSTITKAAEIVKQNAIQGGEFNGQICVLSLIDEVGYPTASVITPSKADGIYQLMLCTMRSGNMAKRAANCNRASVCFSSTEYCINLVGDIEVITDADVKRDVWYDGLSYHFTGADDPDYCVLRFTTKRYKLFVSDEDVAGVV
ncbi:MAG: pyridoxamine 5'-phosphate oxidase family protein [Oscillospiraceae bacterium]|nr:pyridoxamine 5'-phosphate oxidase family protein [Oscillospiraceae bacterium]